MPRRRRSDSGGYDEQRLDSDGRITLSAPQQDELGPIVYVLNWFEDCVRLCSEAGLQQARDFVESAPFSWWQREWALRLTALESPRSVEPEANGRIRIPGTNLAHARLGREATSVLVMPRGSGTYELWEPAHYIEVASKRAEEMQKILWNAAPDQPGGSDGE